MIFYLKNRMTYFLIYFKLIRAKKHVVLASNIIKKIIRNKIINTCVSLKGYKVQFHLSKNKTKIFYYFVNIPSEHFHDADWKVLS